MVVGGGDSATETGMYLAECGHDVTVLTRKGMLAEDAQGVHFYSMMEARWESMPNFHAILRATTVKVEDGAVTYRDAAGEHTISCDSIVVSGGVRRRPDLIARYYGCAPEVLTAGDCRKPGALTDVNFSAWSAASRI